MKTSTGSHSENKIKSFALAAVSVLIWLVIWEVAALAVGRELLLPTPVRTFTRLIELAGTAAFWKSAGLSLLRIVVGYLAGVLLGVISGSLSGLSRISGALFSPLLSIIRATPVASFIILALVWISSGRVPSFTAMLIVWPIVSNNVKTGVECVPTELKEVGVMYRFSRTKRIRLIWLPSVMPYFLSGASTALGLAWKSGIAAEVLCTPKLSIGKLIYESKIYLETADLFAWTAVVIILSVILEKLLSALIRHSGITFEAKKSDGRASGNA